jgi:NAD(P)H-dependent FMN reductase
MTFSAVADHLEPRLTIAVIVGSTRPGRRGRDVGEWAYNIARRRGDADFELLDLADFDLPLLDEEQPAMLLSGSQSTVASQYRKEHTRVWSAAIASFDGYVFVTPEYNHGTSAALKNAIDFLYHEWNDKAAGFVAYGYTLGARAIENLRLVMSAAQVATVRPQVGLSLFTDFQNGNEFKPAELQLNSLNVMLDHLVAWSGAIRPIRKPSPE